MNQKVRRVRATTSGRRRPVNGVEARAVAAEKAAAATEAQIKRRVEERADLGLDEGGVRALKTLRLSAEEYSELMILGPQTRLVGRLTLDRFSSALYSSSPEVFTRIQRRQQSGMSLLEALHVEAGDA